MLCRIWHNNYYYYMETRRPFKNEIGQFENDFLNIPKQAKKYV